LPRRLRRPPSGRIVLILVLFVLALPCVYLGGASAAYFYRHRAANAAAGGLRLPATPAPVLSTRLMVFAPHCDDETLGCAGRIQQTMAAGGSVQTVILTNGDGFRTAVETQMRKLNIGPADYIQFAHLRQQESYRALAALGVSKENVLFLGYPDQGLTPLWNDYWTPEHPFTSASTHCTASPYANTFHPASRYCGQDLSADIKTALRAFHPTVVTVSHPAEDHPDHAGAAAFVALALQELQADPRERDWAKQVRLEYYLVHRGDWPMPQGERTDEPLLPPAEMVRCDTRWKSLALTTAQTDRKNRSIALYPSQTAMMGNFLASFARRNELYGEIAPAGLPTVATGSIHVDADPKDWEALSPVLLDPVRDNVLRDLQGGGDIRAIYACRDQEALYLRLDMRQPISSRIAYSLHLRAFGPQGETSAKAFALTVHSGDAGASRGDGVRVAARERHLEAAIPWSQLTQDLNGEPVALLSVSAETFLAGVNIDRTGARLLQVPR
jgi:LmbE family N-acetylglucosaminyl deacetylase